MESKPVNLSDAALSAVLAGVFLYQFVAALSYPPEPRLFPFYVCGIGFLLSLAILVAAVTPRLAHPAKSEPAPPRTLALAISSPIVYGIGLWLFGYWIASLAAVLAFPLLLGYRRIPTLIATTVVLIVGFGLILPLLSIHLPQGRAIALVLGG